MGLIQSKTCDTNCTTMEDHQINRWIKCANKNERCVDANSYIKTCEKNELCTLTKLDKTTDTMCRPKNPDNDVKCYTMFPHDQFLVAEDTQIDKSWTFCKKK